MSDVSRLLQAAIPALLWVFLWAVGGIWLAQRTFNLRRHEILVVGAGLGWVVQTWLANLFAYFLSVPFAYWAAATVVFLFGFVSWGRFWLSIKQLMSVRIPVGSTFAMLGLALVYTLVGRGLGIFDDYQNLPLTSMLAAGMLPPPFALDPRVHFGYHYFTLLSAAQWMRISGLEPWAALDLARGVVFGICIVLAGLWVYRVTFSRVAGIVGAFLFLFGMGTRWLMLLLPPALLARISDSVVMIGSGRGTAPNLVTAMTTYWAVEGSGPMSIPFAFTNGIFYPPLMFHNGTGMAPALIGFCLLLTATRIKDWRGWVLTCILLSALGLLVEVPVVMSLFVWGLLAGAWAIRHRSLRLPGLLLKWLAAAFVSVLVIVLQGGLLTDAFWGMIARLLGQSADTSYFSLSFPVKFPPAVISAHLGSLSFFNPFQLIAAIFETGPILLVFPLVCIWGWKAFRSGSWYQANVVWAGLVSVIFFFFEYTGSAGISATTRLQGMVLNVCQVFLTPLVWIWLRKRSFAFQISGAVAAVFMCFGGIVLFGLQMVAIQRPIYAEWLGILDKQVYRENWDRLDKDALIFDPVAWRPATIFARLTDSHITWYQSKPGWEKLVDNPDPYALRAWGFTHAYLDQNYWSGLSDQSQKALNAACVNKVKEYSGRQGDFRWLLDIRDCR